MTALGLALATGQSSACVTECAFHPAIVEKHVRSASAIAVPRWSHEIDPRFDDPAPLRGSADANVAASGDTVVVADNGGLIALDSTTGAERWRTAPAHLGIPAIVGDTVVAANAMRRTSAFEGATREIDAYSLRDGTPDWRFQLPSLKPQQPPNPPHVPPDRYLPPVRIVTAGDGVLVSTLIDSSQPYSSDLYFTELSSRGVRRWSRDVGQGNVGRLVALRGGIAYLATEESGAILHDVVRLVRLGPRGGYLGAMPYAIGPLAWNANGDPIFEVAFPMGSATFAIDAAPLAHFTGEDRGRVETTFLWTYAPDALSNPGFAEAAIDGGDLYGFVRDGRQNGAGRLYRYAFAPPAGQRPLLLSTSVTQWVAGPSNGWNIVEESGDLVALRVRGGEEERVRLASDGPLRTSDAVAFDGHRLYVARYDGRVLGFDLDAATTILDAPTRCVYDASINRDNSWRSIGVHGDRLFAVCSHRLYAFALPAGT